MRSAVVVFPGIYRERDMARALKLVTGREPAMVWHADTALPAGTELVVLPGGFSYGDYLRCGAIAARAPIMHAVRQHAGRGGLVLGVCNGFQILCEAGLLPGVLMRNRTLKFICCDVFLRVERSGPLETAVEADRAGKVVQAAFTPAAGHRHVAAARQRPAVLALDRLAVPRPPQPDTMRKDLGHGWFRSRDSRCE